MTVLAAITLNDTTGLVLQDRLVHNMNKITSILNWVRGTYSERLYIILDRMLIEDPHRRNDFSTLEKIFEERSISRSP